MELFRHGEESPPPPTQHRKRRGYERHADVWLASFEKNKICYWVIISKLRLQLIKHTHTHTHTHSRTQTHSCSKERERQGMMGRERERIKSSLSLSVRLHLFLCAIGVIVSASRCWLSSIWLKKFRRKRKTAGEREKEWHTWGIYSYISLIIYIYILSACVREREREREREFVQLQLVVLLRLRLSLLSQPIIRCAWVEVQPITGLLVLHEPIMFQSGHHKSAEGETEVENQWPGPLKHSNSSQQQELSQYSSYI